MSISSETQLCNNALILLGQSTITAINEGTPTANVCQQLYAPTRNDLLAQHFWNFATKRVSIASDAVAPVFEWANSYQLPADFFRVKKIYDSDADYIIESDKILTDQTTELKLVYIAKITDTVAFSPLFTTALIARMAMLLCQQIKGSDSSLPALQQMYMEALRTAKIADAQDGTPEALTANSYQDARMGSMRNWETRDI